MYKLVIYFVIILLFACKSNRNKVEDVIKEMNGKEIILPNTLLSTFNGRDSVLSNLSNRKFKIIVYTDSLGCTDCKMQLSQWKSILSQVSEISNKLSIIFIVNPPKGKENRIRMLLKLKNFSYPIYIDRCNQFGKANKFIDNQYNTFLVDQNNKILLIGSPIKNERLWMLYMKEICKGLKLSGKTNFCSEVSKLQIADISENTLVEITNNSINIGLVLLNSNNKTNFTIKNIGSKPLVIFAVNTSCGCTGAKYDKKPVLVGKSAIVSLEFKPYSVGRFQKTAEVVCNIPDKVIKLQISGEVAKNRN